MHNEQQIVEQADKGDVTNDNINNKLKTGASALWENLDLEAPSEKVMNRYFETQTFLMDTYLNHLKPMVTEIEVKSNAVPQYKNLGAQLCIYIRQIRQIRQTGYEGQINNSIFSEIDLEQGSDEILKQKFILHYANVACDAFIEAQQAKLGDVILNEEDEEDAVLAPIYLSQDKVSTLIQHVIAKGQAEDKVVVPFIVNPVVYGLPGGGAKRGQDLVESDIASITDVLEPALKKIGFLAALPEHASVKLQRQKIAGIKKVRNAPVLRHVQAENESKTEKYSQANLQPFVLAHKLPNRDGSMIEEINTVVVSVSPILTVPLAAAKIDFAARDNDKINARPQKDTVGFAKLLHVKPYQLKYAKDTLDNEAFVQNDLHGTKKGDVNRNLLRACLYEQYSDVLTKARSERVDQLPSEQQPIFITLLGAEKALAGEYLDIMEEESVLALVQALVRHNKCEKRPIYLNAKPELCELFSTLYSLAVKTYYDGEAACREIHSTKLDSEVMSERCFEVFKYYADQLALENAGTSNSDNEKAQLERALAFYQEIFESVLKDEFNDDSRSAIFAVYAHLYWSTPKASKALKKLMEGFLGKKLKDYLPELASHYAGMWFRQDVQAGMEVAILVPFSSMKQLLCHAILELKNNPDNEAAKKTIGQYKLENNTHYVRLKGVSKGDEREFVEEVSKAIKCYLKEKKSHLTEEKKQRKDEGWRRAQFLLQHLKENAEEGSTDGLNNMLLIYSQLTGHENSQKAGNALSLRIYDAITLWGVNKLAAELQGIEKIDTLGEDPFDFVQTVSRVLKLKTWAELDDVLDHVKKLTLFYFKNELEKHSAVYGTEQKPFSVSSESSSSLAIKEAVYKLQCFLHSPKLEKSDDIQTMALFNNNNNNSLEGEDEMDLNFPKDILPTSFNPAAFAKYPHLCDMEVDSVENFKISKVLERQQEANDNNNEQKCSIQ